MPQAGILDWIPLGEAALRCHIARDRLRRMCETGVVSGEIRNGRLHVRAADVDRLAAQQQAAAT